MNRQGLTSAQPATISFTILPPFYQRPWFLLLVVAVLAVSVHALYRIRLRRLLELERVRMRIATDLHDDIGAGLSQIAILSELMKGEAEDMAYSNDPYAAAYDKHDASVDDGGDPARAGVTAPLTKIAASSRELVGSMSDIVWAINPQKDHLGDLVGRMRRFASDVLAASDIEFRFRTEGVETESALAADVRREVFLIFKESINNICKHAACTEVIAEFKVASDGILLRIEDDGKGFDINGNSAGGLGLGGHGMASMRARAARLGGTLTVTSEIGTGTTLTMRLPHKMRRWSFPRRKKRDSG